jgi:competence protein ComEC
MRAVWCGFALGVTVLQQQALWPSRLYWLALLTVLGGALASAFWGLRGQRGLARWRVHGGWCAVWLTARCAGFGYAAWRAGLRLSVSLPQPVGGA